MAEIRSSESVGDLSSHMANVLVAVSSGQRRFRRRNPFMAKRQESFAMFEDLQNSIQLLESTYGQAPDILRFCDQALIQIHITDARVYKEAAQLNK